MFFNVAVGSVVLTNVVFFVLVFLVVPAVAVRLQRSLPGGAGVFAGAVVVVVGVVVLSVINVVPFLSVLSAGVGSVPVAGWLCCVSSVVTPAVFLLCRMLLHVWVSYRRRDAALMGELARVNGWGYPGV